MIRKGKCYWCKKVIHRGGIKGKAYKASHFQVVVVGKRYFHKACRSKMLANKRAYKKYHWRRGER